ncbi:MAG: stage II sporulation protein P [Dethiobacteraceae bacterium]|jgi:stage II sporulation protein P
MAGRIYFPIRSRRFRPGSSKQVWLLLLAAVLLLGGYFLYSQQIKPVSVFAVNPQPGVFPQIDGSSSIFLRLVASVIPGFDQHRQSGNDSETGSAGEFSLPKLALNNWHDPKKVICTQIPYLDTVPEALLSQSAAEQSEPQITFPLRQQLTGERTVLLYHTHATESFVPSSGSAFAAADLSQTITQLGAELADLLQNEYQIPVYHDRTIHDVPRTGAYERALPRLTALLNKYPETVLVVDLHRDGVAKKITTTELNGQAAARVLFVVGSRHEKWRENMSKAEFLHNALEKMAPGISRGIRERPLVYNQDVHPGCLLIELGGYQNSLEEARRTLPLLAEALALLYRSGQ